MFRQKDGTVKKGCSLPDAFSEIWSRRYAPTWNVGVKLKVKAAMPPCLIA
jgi:hypothetical protein